MDVQRRCRRLALAAGVVLGTSVTASAAWAWPTPQASQSQDRGQDSLSIAEIRHLIQVHHPAALLANPGTDAVWIVVDADYHYVWSTADDHSSVTDVLLRARKAQLTDALVRVNLASMNPGSRADSLARVNLDVIIKDLRHYATLADVSHVSVAALPDFLDVEGMTQLLTTRTFNAGELGKTALTVTTVLLKAATAD
jgi:hypothetical protein